MHEEIDRLIGSVRREVGQALRDGRPVRIARAERDFDAEVADLWDALTDPGRISCWLLPVSGDLRLGGRYQLKGNASGIITGCEPPRRLAVTWETLGEVSWVAVELSPAGEHCAHLALEHVACVEPAHWKAFGPGAIGVGWDLALMGLARHLCAPTASVDPVTADGWAHTNEGREFMKKSAGAWGHAAIDAGEDRFMALAAAARTAQAYAGEESDAG